MWQLICRHLGCWWKLKIRKCLHGALLLLCPGITENCLNGGEGGGQTHIMPAQMKHYFFDAFVNRSLKNGPDSGFWFFVAWDGLRMRGTHPGPCRGWPEPRWASSLSGWPPGRPAAAWRALCAAQRPTPSTFSRALDTAERKGFRNIPEPCC